MTEKILSVKDGCFSFAEKQVLHDINLEINKHDFVGIIGPNGAGKSTLLRILAGILNNTAGEVKLHGQNISAYDRKKLAAMLAYVPQSVDIAFPFMVKEVLNMGRFPLMKGILDTGSDDSEIIRQVLVEMDLQELKNRPYNSLSGGEKQRTIIASALVQQAEVILLDEPTSALDLKHQHLVLEYLVSLQKEKDAAVIIVTHDINLASRFCSRLIMLDEGRILADGTPDEVLQFSLIQQVYGVKVYIDVNPFTKSVYVLPYELGG